MPKTTFKIHREKMNHVFITGFPGFLGKQFTKYLLHTFPKTRVTLLVEQSFMNEALKEIKNLKPSLRNRCQIFSGDICKMDLGLSGDECTQILDDCTHFIHLAAVHDTKARENELFRVNVEGTKNTLEFACEMKSLKRYIYFSSCHVSGNRIGVITEDELQMEQRFHNPYEKSKLLAEKKIHKYLDKLPINIFRPGTIVGNSTTGEIDHFRGVYNLAISMVTSSLSVPVPLPGDGSAPFNVVPVDFITKASIEICSQKESVGKTFHLVDPNPQSFARVYELIAKKLGKNPTHRRRIKYSVARPFLKLPIFGKHNSLDLQSMDELAHLAIYNSANTLEHLHGSGITCPQIHTYVNILIDYVQKQYKKTD